MDTTRDISTKELLLQIMELTSFGLSSRAQISKQLRRRYPIARLDRRLDNALEVLLTEELITADDGAGNAEYRTTRQGLTVLEQNGRYTAAATVLFTDIVGSTQLIDDVGETQAHEMRQRHFALLRDTISAAGGREVKNLGDGVMAIFAKREAAIACANEMQRRVADDPDQLELRVGVHEGELLRDGNDFFGSTVIIARRLCDLAEPGQTIVSDSTLGQLDSSRGEAFASLGELTLKGLSDSVAASALLWKSPAESLGR